MKNLLYILLLFGGCKSETASENSQTLNNSDTASGTITQPQANQDAEILQDGSFQFENDDVGGYPFMKDFESMLGSMGQFEITKKPFRNVQDTTQTDTLVTVNFGRSVIEYYKLQAGAAGFIIGATIASNDVEFKKGIKIGMDDREFCALFDELAGKENLNSVMIATLEGLNQTEFLFVNGKLSTVKYQSYFD